MRLLLALLLLAAVPLKTADVVGLYRAHEMEMASELQLRADGSFEYALIYGAADFWAKGKWHCDQDCVVLDSAPTKNPPFRLTRSLKTKESGIRVWVEGQNGKPVGYVGVGLRCDSGPGQAETRDDGPAVFPDARGARQAVLEVPVYEYTSPPIDVNPDHNEFHFRIDGAAVSRVPFKNERLSLEGSTLIMRFWNADHPLRYERVNPPT